nr:transcription factor bHLH62-like [Tanacetum cinerariifolium]
QPFPYGIQSQNIGTVSDRSENQFHMNPLMMAAMHGNSLMKPSHVDGLGEASTFWENDLQS